MKVKIVADSLAGGRLGYELFAKALANGSRVFGLATGSTPVSTYDQITASELDFSHCISINLDEYVGLAPTHPQSYHAFMQAHFFKQKPFSNSFVPNGLNPDENDETTRYEEIIANHPIDFQILGLGRNGHIGFNEPGTEFDSATHRVALTQSTIDANARFFADKDEVPHFAYSMGIGTIMKSKQILIEAYGANKAEAVQQMIEGPVTKQVPASILQQHANVTVIIDQAAAANLTKKY
ncbi:glucosamine-6-phosphate deaminase [Paucilactobacillus wasatchensis]|uniref:Glucosamine-6-phosphate deaminase n=1 Tax=Paucilactobacillus wasatchensis TaxID=1335616 RepID=A0A0D1A890_9LACO|nr:glucosamine-6-phosphate deaminase [Paucilactobacillus wasatchensis]KIS03937.1 Glucosamine-6-phosphate deaminase [Paucilactobacillus wasatchensis]